MAKKSGISKLVKVHFCNGGKMKYADGGKVPEPSKKPDPGMLGSGLAAKAGEALKSRKQKLDDAIAAAGG